MSISIVNLKELNLKSVGIQELATNAFEGMISLEVLNLHKNQLAQLDSRPFQGLGKLIRLWGESICESGPQVV